MKISVKFCYRSAFLAVGFMNVFFHAIPSYAADIPGMYPPIVDEQEKKAEKEDFTPLRRVFSSKLKNASEAEKLDTLYHSLENYLWEVSQTNQIHQKKLMDLLLPQKFQYTRRQLEFKIPMMMAMDDLNKNRKDFKEFFAKVGKDFEPLKVAFNEEEADATKLWNEKTGELEVLADKYFKSQHKYLNLYNKLVSYIMQHAGGYYYSSGTSRVMFYKIDEYTYFGETIDSLNKISFGQRKILQDVKPLEYLP